MYLNRFLILTILLFSPRFSSVINASIEDLWCYQNELHVLEDILKVRTEHMFRKSIRNSSAKSKNQSRSYGAVYLWNICDNYKAC